MGWFKRLKEGIQTSTSNKKEAPDGICFKCTSCKQTSTNKEVKENFHKCPKCDYHVRIGSAEYFDLLFDGKRTVLFDNIRSTDFLNFEDSKPYSKRIVEAQKKTGLSDAIAVAHGKVNKKDLVIACMDFSFIGGSMGSVVGERISLAIEYCIENKIPFLLISKSGGARMMESAFSLMQMAKTSAMLGLLADENIPYFSLMTDPTTGGVTASYAMLGDLNFSEPNAMIGFAGPRVIKETIKKELPENFQSAESLLENGFLDFIVNRKDLKERMGELLTFFPVK